MTRMPLLVLVATALLATVPLSTADATVVADRAASARPKLHTYSDKQGSVTSATVHDRRKLPKSPPTFRSFIDRRLTVLWKTDLHSDPACARSAVINVNAVRTDGYGKAAIGTNQQRGCDRAVAGHVELFAKRHGQWRMFFGGEDIPPCAKLRKVGFPSAVGVHKCMDGTRVVDYRHP